MYNFTQLWSKANGRASDRYGLRVWQEQGRSCRSGGMWGGRSSEHRLTFPIVADLCGFFKEQCLAGEGGSGKFGVIGRSPISRPQGAYRAAKQHIALRSNISRGRRGGTPSARISRADRHILPRTGKDDKPFGRDMPPSGPRYTSFGGAIYSLRECDMPPTGA